MQEIAQAAPAPEAVYLRAERLDRRLRDDLIARGERPTKYRKAALLGISYVTYYRLMGGVDGVASEPPKAVIDAVVARYGEVAFPEYFESRPVPPVVEKRKPRKAVAA